MVRGLISERSYPWAVEPAGLNGSIRHRLRVKAQQPVDKVLLMKEIKRNRLPARTAHV